MRFGGKREIRVGEAERGYWMLILENFGLKYNAISDWWWTFVRGGTREFVNDTGGPAFLERELMGLGVDGYW